MGGERERGGVAVSTSVCVCVCVCVALLHWWGVLESMLERGGAGSGESCGEGGCFLLSDF